MRISQLTVSTVLACMGLSVSAQTAVTGPSDDWRRVEQLSPHTKIKISADHRHTTCLVDSVDEEKLVCSHSSNGSADQIAFPRPEIRKIRLSGRGHSALVGLGIGVAVGAGAGAGVGAAINSSDKGSFLYTSGGKAAAVGAGVGAIVGAAIGPLVGYASDWPGGTTIYIRH
jgi:hypothetical protein